MRTDIRSRRMTRTAVALIACLSIVGLSGCTSSAQKFRDASTDYGMSFSLASDEIIDLYGETACVGGRKALGRLLAAESSARVDTVYDLAIAAYCPD